MVRRFDWYHRRLSGTQQQNLICEEHRIVNVVGHDDETYAVFPDIGLQIIHQQFLVVRIECTEWLIHEQARRCDRKRPSDADSLLRTAGQCRGVRMRDRLQLQTLQQCFATASAPGAGDTRAFQPIDDVIEHGHPWEKVVVLKNDRACRGRSPHQFAAERNRASART